MYSFLRVLKERCSGYDWHSIDKSDGYSDDFIQKSNVLFDCIKKNKMFREAAYTIIKNFENEIGWQFFNTVKYNLSGSNHRKMFRDIEKNAITYALTLIKKERVNYYYYPTEKKLYKEKNKLEKIETQMKRKINHIEKLKSNLQNSDFFAKKLDKILK